MSGGGLVTSVTADALPARRRMPWSIRIAVGWLLAIAAIAIFGPGLAPHDIAFQQPLNRLMEPRLIDPQSPFWLGSDHLGRDVLSRAVSGLRLSIAVAIMGALVGAMIGLSIGLVAGHYGGWVDNVLMGLVDVGAAVPFIVIALACLAFFGNSFVLFVILMGLAGWEKYARLVRGLVIDGATRNYTGAVRALGASAPRIYARHILPNMAAPLVVQFSLNLPEIILLETGLSFLGLGIQPPLASLGLMMSEGRDHLSFAWWIVVAPGTLIFLTTLAVSLVGDWLRDRFDPTLG
ncbi:MAG: ABC transporter permease [Beijerinckiaceae bacterium]